MEVASFGQFFNAYGEEEEKRDRQENRARGPVTGKMQYGHFFPVQNEETGSMDILQRRKISIPAVWTFCSTKKSPFQRFHPLAAEKNPYQASLKAKSIYFFGQASFSLPFF